ncbi:MAG: histidinol-phosphate transaminase [Robiginitomaculum sp.]|nr:histidinol-phosphate transaminase [Robiginitomaculum sp.]
MTNQPDPRPGLLDIMAYRGGVADAPGFAAPVKLSSNENCFGASEAAKQAIANESSRLERYPDGGAILLREALAKKHALPVEKIVCGCGSDELLQLLGRSYLRPGDEVLFSAHGFLTYKLIALQNEAVPIMVPEDDLQANVERMLASVTRRTRLVFVANPNNPTGYMMPKDDLYKLHAGLPKDVLLVVDAAYAEYVDDPNYSCGMELARKFDNVMTTRTFSKAYGLAGLRIGWTFCPQRVADVLNRVRSPFNANRLGQAAAIAALADDDFVARSAEHVQKWRPWLTDEIGKCGIRVYPSAGNFVLLGFDGDANKADAAEQFLMRKGLILRGMRGFGLPGYLRLTIGLDDENRAFAGALMEFMRQYK